MSNCRHPHSGGVLFCLRIGLFQVAVRRFFLRKRGRRGVRERERLRPAQQSFLPTIRLQTLCSRALKRKEFQDFASKPMTTTPVAESVNLSVQRGNPF